MLMIGPWIQQNKVKIYILLYASGTLSIYHNDWLCSRFSTNQKA